MHINVSGAVATLLSVQAITVSVDRTDVRPISSVSPILYCIIKVFFFFFHSFPKKV